MILDSHGLPKDLGASDWMDSPRLSGMMAIVHHPKTPNLDLYVNSMGLARRNPYLPKESDVNDFSRDQLMLLATGLHLQGRFGTCEKLYILAEKRFYRAQNGDFLSPSQMNHLRLCADLPGTNFGYLWLKQDILWNRIVCPLSINPAEANQLLGMCIVAGPEYVELFCKNKWWKRQLWIYWCEWREPDYELFNLLVKEVETYL